MRTIKFRGKRVDNGEWVYGSLHYRTTDCEKVCFKDGANNHSLVVMTMPIIEVYDENDHDLLCDYPVIADTVGQFTGLTDKNGKEIYEGDILGRDGYWSFYVGFELGSFVLFPCNEIQRNNWGAKLITDEYLGRFEIIGNIHDNPELLKGGNNV